MTVPSVILPGRQRYMYMPMKKAIGIVMAIVNMPHGLSLSALTTARPTPASAMIRMMRMAMVATTPVTRSISRRASSASDLPSRRIEATRTTKSWTAPPSTTPMISQRRPGRNPNCAASTGPISGPGPLIAAK
jgi:hypothetical protein